MTRNRILLVEDEEGLVMTLTDRLESEGYSVTHVGDGPGGEKKALRGRFDVIVLDVMLPGKNGFDIVRDIRAHGIATPVLLLTARGQVEEKVVGLKLGADDYLTKPFDMMELVARIEALLRRPTQTTREGENSEIHSFGSISINLRKREVSRNSQRIELSALEFRLLQYLVHNEGVVITRQEILKEVWGYEDTPSTRTVDTHVTWLRRKLEIHPSHPSHILTVHGVGYKFVR